MRRCWPPIAFCFAAWLTLTLWQAFCLSRAQRGLWGQAPGWLPRSSCTLHCCPLHFFFLLVAVLMQHLQHGIRLPWDPVQRRNLPSVAHSTTVPFPSLTMDFYFIYCLLPSCTLEREIVVTKIKYLKIACGGHPVVSLTEVCLTPHCRDLGPQDSKVLMSICLYCWSIAQKCPKPGLPIFNSAYLFKKKHWKIIWKLSC